MVAEASGILIYFAIAAVGWVNPGVYGKGVYVSELYPTHSCDRGRLVWRRANGSLRRQP